MFKMFHPIPRSPPSRLPFYGFHGGDNLLFQLIHLPNPQFFNLNAKASKVESTKKISHLNYHARIKTATAGAADGKSSVNLHLIMGLRCEQQNQTSWKIFRFIVFNC